MVNGCSAMGLSFRGVRDAGISSAMCVYPTLEGRFLASKTPWNDRDRALVAPIGWLLPLREEGSPRGKVGRPPRPYAVNLIITATIVPCGPVARYTLSAQAMSSL